MGSRSCGCVLPSIRRRKRCGNDGAPELSSAASMRRSRTVDEAVLIRMRSSLDHSQTCRAVRGALLRLHFTVCRCGGRRSARITRAVAARATASAHNSHMVSSLHNAALAIAVKIRAIDNITAISAAFRARAAFCASSTFRKWRANPVPPVSSSAATRPPSPRSVPAIQAFCEGSPPR